MSFTTLQIADAGDTSRTFSFYQDGSGNFYSTPVIADAAGHILFTSTTPGYVQFGSAQSVSISGTPSVSISGTPDVLVTDGSNTLLTSSNPAYVQFASSQHVIVDSATLGTVAVSGTFWQATQPVSIASLPAVPAGSNLIGQIEVSDGANVLFTSSHPGCVQFGSAQAVTLASTTITGTVAATQSGTWNIGTVTAVTAITDALPAGTNAIGGVTITGSTTGGASSYHLVAANSTNATNVKASAGTLKGVQVYNIGSAVAFVKLYDTSGTPTAGSGTPKKVIAIPGNTAGAGSNVPLPPEGLVFASGIAFTVTAGIADTDATAVPASNILIELDYK